MMAASSAKEDGREEKKEPSTVTEEGSKPISTSDVSGRALWMLFVLIIILFAAVIVAVSCGVGGYVYMSQRIDKLVNDSVHSCAQLNEDGIQTPWQHLEQNVSMLYDHIHELYSVYTKISAIELNVSQLNANSTNVQLLNLAFALSELQDDLDSTTRNFLTTKSALDENISQLNAWANRIELQLANLTATLGGAREARDALQQTISLLRAEVFSNFSTIQSQLDTYANRTDAQLRDFASAQSEMRHNLTSTRQELLASKSAIDLLTIHANSTELHLRNITSTLSELHGDIDDNQHLLNQLSSMYEEHERKIHQITLNISRFHENVSLLQEIQAQEVSTLQFNLSSLINNQISAIENDVERRHDDLSDEQSRIDARLRELEAKVNSASTASPLYLVVLLSIFFVLHV